MANPLSLLMPVIPGTTLGTLLKTQAGRTDEIDAALASIGTVHFARFLFLDRSQPNLIPLLSDIDKPSDTLVIAVITEYDGSFSAYISDFVAQLGAVFDAMLVNVVGGAAVIPVQNNVQAFEAFIAANDASQHVPNNTLYSAYPQTVQQVLAAFS
jgi:hypothetical protein